MCSGCLVLDISATLLDRTKGSDSISKNLLCIDDHMRDARPLNQSTPNDFCDFLQLITAGAQG